MKNDGLAGVHNLAENGLVFSVGEERKMVPSFKLVPGVATGLRVGFVSPDKVKIPVEVDQLSIRVGLDGLKTLACMASSSSAFLRLEISVMVILEPSESGTPSISAHKEPPLTR
jgi:hypothetical protein